MACSTLSIVLTREKGNTKTTHLCRREVGNKKVIHTDLCMAKYITYIPTYITKLSQFVHNEAHANYWGERDIINIIILLIKRSSNTIENKFIKWWSFTQNGWGQRDIINRIINITKTGSNTISNQFGKLWSSRQMTAVNVTS